MKHILLLLALVFVSACSTVPTDLDRASVSNSSTQAISLGPNAQAIDATQSSFEFEGYAPGKSHVGTFTFYDGFLLVENGVVVGANGTINVSSVKTDNSGLDKHLVTDDFFDAERFPTITFSGVVSDGKLVGPLLFRGVSKQLEIPVNVTGTTMTAEFLLDTTDFNFKYVGVNKDVRIAFTMVG